MNKYKRYFIELSLVLIVTFSMIAYYKHDPSEMSLDAKTGVKSAFNNPKFENADSLTFAYPSNSIDVNRAYGKADNIRIIKGDNEVKIQCAKGYTFLGEFPKENDYTKYKCTQMPCKVETAEITYYFDYKASSIYYDDISYANIIVNLSNSLIKTKAVRRFGNIDYEKDKSITKIACVPRDQLSHWKIYHWYSL
ncbi:hypothetical protein [Francisella tularensis]|uniref:hypothetical protein n=1 Tax=Francisella tularensis TaxID=263 RepID=UPI001C0EB3F0|nr:hypothetical protein [Francisella tularensis]MBK2109069.1 hypothetical protein [Francisella tularensis subsp. novicida FSC595]